MTGFFSISHIIGKLKEAIRKDIGIHISSYPILEPALAHIPFIPKFLFTSFFSITILKLHENLIDGVQKPESNGVMGIIGGKR